jgi:hypothetical protein
MVAKHDRKKKHHGRRKRGSRIRKRMWAQRHGKKIQKVGSKRRGRRLKGIRKYPQR